MNADKCSCGYDGGPVVLKGSADASCPQCGGDWPNRVGYILGSVYTRPQIVNGTGFKRGIRFLILTDEVLNLFRSVVDQEDGDSPLGEAFGVLLEEAEEPDTTKAHVRGCPRSVVGAAECLCNPARTGLRSPERWEQG